MRRTTSGITVMVGMGGSSLGAVMVPSWARDLDDPWSCWFLLGFRWWPPSGGHQPLWGPPRSCHRPCVSFARNTNPRRTSMDLLDDLDHYVGHLDPGETHGPTMDRDRANRILRRIRRRERERSQVVAVAKA